jgi:hypothetical protein
MEIAAPGGGAQSARGRVRHLIPKSGSLNCEFRSAEARRDISEFVQLKFRTAEFAGYLN